MSIESIDSIATEASVTANSEPLEAEPQLSASASRTVSQAVEDYIKTIYKLQQATDRVSTNDIARTLSTSPAAVTKMSKYLAERHLLTHEPYYGVRLTTVGEKIALETIRHHRLLELYLVQALGYGWDEVDAEAERLEHHISEEFEERIDSLLGRPQIDPHGDPIPTRDGFMPPQHAGRRLIEAQPGEKLVVRRVSDGSAEALRDLTRLGIHLGAQVELLIPAAEEAAEMPTEVLAARINGQERSIAAALAACIFTETEAAAG